MWTLWNVPVIPAGVFVDGSLKFTKCLKPLPSSPIHQTTAELADASGLFERQGQRVCRNIPAAYRSDFPKSGSVLLEPLQAVCAMSCEIMCTMSTAYVHCLNGLFKCRDAKCLHHGLRRLRLDLHFLAACNLQETADLFM